MHSRQLHGTANTETAPPDTKARVTLPSLTSRFTITNDLKCADASTFLWGLFYWHTSNLGEAHG